MSMCPRQGGAQLRSPRCSCLSRWQRRDRGTPGPRHSSQVPDYQPRSGRLGPAQPRGFNSGAAQAAVPQPHQRRAPAQPALPALPARARWKGPKGSAGPGRRRLRSPAGSPGPGEKRHTPAAARVQPGPRSPSPRPELPQPPPSRPRSARLTATHGRSRPPPQVRRAASASAREAPEQRLGASAAPGAPPPLQRPLPARRGGRESGGGTVTRHTQDCHCHPDTHRAVTVTPAHTGLSLSPPQCRGDSRRHGSELHPAGRKRRGTPPGAWTAGNSKEVK